MKQHIASLIPVICTIILSSCLEEVKYEQDQFVKILGLEGSSIGEKIIELDNGDLMILGEMGIAAHEVESTNIGVQLTEVEDQAPFIAITDPNGNLKRLRMYPIEDFQLNYFKVLNTTNRTTFKTIIPVSDGYVVLAQLFDFDFELSIPGAALYTDLSKPGDFNYAPLLFKLDQKFNITELHSFNGQSNDLPEFSRSKTSMKPLPGGEIGILFGSKISLQNGFAAGYSFLRLTEKLDTIELAEDFDSGSQKLAYDFDLGGDNFLNVLGSQDNNIYLYKLPLDALRKENERATFINFSGQFPGNFNTNEHFVKTMDNENTLLVYTHPSSRSINAAILNPSGVELQNIEIGKGEDFNGEIRAPRAVFEMANGDLLVYVLNIPDDASPVYGYLYRYTIKGELIFRKRIDGTPGDMIETKDGNIVVLSNSIYNGILQRIHLYKLNAYGELY